jgi:hypothetical protein
MWQLNQMYCRQLFEILEFLMLASAKKFLAWLKNIFIAGAAVV